MADLSPRKTRRQSLRKKTIEAGESSCSQPVTSKSTDTSKNKQKLSVQEQGKCGKNKKINKKQHKKMPKQQNDGDNENATSMMDVIDIGGKSFAEMQEDVKFVKQELKKNILSYNSTQSGLLQNSDENEKNTFETFNAVDLSSSILPKKEIKPDTPVKSYKSTNSVNQDDNDIRNMLLKFESKEKLCSDMEKSNTVDVFQGSSDESDWEDVADVVMDSPKGTSSQVPSGPVEITLEGTDIMRKKRKKKKFDIEEWFRLQMNKFRRQTQSNVHKVHLLCLVSHGLWGSKICNTDLLQACMLSQIPNQFLKISSKKWSQMALNSYTLWFKKTFTLDHYLQDERKENHDVLEQLIKAAENCKATHKTHLLYLYISSLIVLGIDVRLIMSLQPVSFKAKDLKTKSGDAEKMPKEKQKSATNYSKSSMKKRAHSQISRQIPKSESAKGDKKTNLCKSVEETESQYFKKHTSQNCHKDQSKKRKIQCNNSKDNGEIIKRKSGNSNLKQGKGNDANTNQENYDSGISEMDVRKNSALVNNSKISAQPKNSSRRKMASKVKYYGEQSEECSSDNNTQLSNTVDKAKEKKRTSLEKSNVLTVKKSKQDHKKNTNQFHEVKTLSSDEEFVPDKTIFRSPGSKNNSKKKKSKSVEIILSESENSFHMFDNSDDTWVEVYLETPQKWICVDCEYNIVDKPVQMEERATQPVQYVLAFLKAGHVKDVTKKYVANWMSSTRKLRHDNDWWEETMSKFAPPSSEKTVQEDRHVQAKLMSQPMPTAVGDFKNHPLYALRRHLLKFEAIYPSDAPPLGFVRNEPVYARECVQTLHSRENWMKEARLVRVGEEAYKWVKARPKRNKSAETITNDPTLALYGYWQTEDYIPFPAVNGKVPRNEYGNVELFKPSMLPGGTVHLQGLPGLNRIAKKLDIDAVAAMTGWEHHGGYACPMLDGWVVCEEHKDTLLAAWDEQQEIDKQREQEKREKRVLDNWRKLTKGLIIKQKIQKKYNLVDPKEKSKNDVEESEMIKTTTIATDTAVSWPLNRQQEKHNKTKTKKINSSKKGKQTDAVQLFPFEVETM